MFAPSKDALEKHRPFDGEGLFLKKRFVPRILSIDPPAVLPARAAQEFLWLTGYLGHVTTVRRPYSLLRGWIVFEAAQRGGKRPI